MAGTADALVSGASRPEYVGKDGDVRRKSGSEDEVSLGLPASLLPSRNVSPRGIYNERVVLSWDAHSIWKKILQLYLQ
jgi:hypothetical protein